MEDGGQQLLKSQQREDCWVTLGYRTESHAQRQQQQQQQLPRLLNNQIHHTKHACIPDGGWRSMRRRTTTTTTTTAAAAAAPTTTPPPPPPLLRLLLLPLPLLLHKRIVSVRYCKASNEEDGLAVSAIVPWCGHRRCSPVTSCENRRRRRVRRVHREEVQKASGHEAGSCS